MEKDVIVTREGLEKLEQELEELKTVKRKEVADRLKQAISFGDLSENSEYEDAKSEQGFIEGRIITLENMLKNVKVIEDMQKDAKVVEDNQTDECVVSIGSLVRVKDIEMDEEEEYKLVGTIEADPMNNRISNESPVGHAIIGHKAGDVVDVEVPAGIIKYEILTVTNA